MQEAHARAFLDDDLKILCGLVEHHTFAMPFFIKQLWNQSAPPEESGITTVSGWADFGRRLLYLKQMHEAICRFKKWENAYYNLPRIAAFWNANPAVCGAYLEDYKREPVGAHA